jgi:hypothetical protein
MKTTWMPVVALVAFPLAGWSAEKGETHVTMDQLPAAVKATIERESAGGKVEEPRRRPSTGRPSTRPRS